MFSRQCILLIFLVGFYVIFSTANDWPEYRGAGRIGVWDEPRVVNQLDGETLKLKWSVPIGPGYSGPTVQGDRVFAMDRVDTNERVVCLDRETGETLWVHAYAASYEGVGFPLGPRASVTIEEGLAWSMGAMGHLFCLDVLTGRVVWEVNGLEAYSIDMPNWGIAGSPLVAGDLVIVQMGGREGACVVAFDKATGMEAWRAFDDKASYVSPRMITQAGQPILVVWTADRIAGMSAQTGEVYWEHETPPERWPINTVGPALNDSGELMFLTTIGEGSRLLRLSQDELAVEELWARKGVSESKTDALQSMISPPLFFGGYIYGVDSYGQLRCLDPETGDRIWESAGEAVREGVWSTVFMVQNHSRTWMFTEEGNLIIAELSPEGYQEISRANVIKPTTFLKRRSTEVAWSHPAFAGTEVFVRNDETLVCVDLVAPES
ncbi:MAG: PQQ-binding-like beta-propeller repeat protein [Verrucomicrobiota bacterium]